MLQLQPLDPNAPIFNQLSSDASLVVLVNVFQATSDIPGLLKAWEDDANWMNVNQGISQRNCIGPLAEAICF